MRTLFAIAVLASILAPAAFADDNEQNGHSSVCTMGNVAGIYGYVGFGTALPGNPFMVTGTYSCSGTLAFDGKGHLLIIDTARIERLHAVYGPKLPGNLCRRRTVQCHVQSSRGRGGTPLQGRVRGQPQGIACDKSAPDAPGQLCEHDQNLTRATDNSARMPGNRGSRINPSGRTMSEIFRRERTI